MQSSPLVIVALVGLALVCVGLLVVAGVLLARRVIGQAVDTDDDENSPRRGRASSKPDLRAIAQAQDFDAAVARQGGQPATRTLPPRAPGSGADAPFSAEIPPLAGPSGKRFPTRRAPNRSDEDEEDGLADFVDDL